MAAVRLPGIYFETVTPPTTPLLPRMDIAAFAGFLPSGPIGVPFAVEDPDRFADVFGADLVLAWDRQRGEMLLAQTPPAVRMFFRNGGTRCWVLRLAQGALPNAWVIPGLLAADGQGAIHAGWTQARSEGSWSDDFTVNATLLESPVAPSSLTLSGSIPQVTGLNPGDMVQLYFPSTETLAYNACGDPRWFWFQQVSSSSVPASAPDSAMLLGPGTDTPVPFSAFAWQAEELILTVTRDTALTIPPGSWLKLGFGNRCLLVQVESMDAVATGPASPPSAELATLTITLAWWMLDPAAALAANRNQTVQISVVTFELWAWPPGEPVQRIADLGLSPAHPRYWGLLPTDAALYAPVDRPTTIPYAALADDIDNPRFDLAGPFAGGLGLPLAMTALVRSDFTQGASQPGATALDRDGLTNFSPALFIDKNLSSSTAATLLQDAFYYQYQSPSPAAPAGIQALLGTDEISLLAVPDAIQLGWQPAPAANPTLGSPAPIQASEPDEGGNYTVSWNAVHGATGYSLQESSDPLFGSSIATRDAGAALSLSLSNSAQCPLELYYRVSAYGTAGVGPWSDTASVQLGTGDFSPCNVPALNAPTLALIEERNRITLQWAPAPGAADSFTLESAGDPQFTSGLVLYQGSETSFESWQTPGPSTYFRVNAQLGVSSSPWSATVSTVPEPVSPWEVNDPGAAGQSVLLAVHRAMIRMAAARGDLVAILSLPVWYFTADAVAYAAQFAEYVADEDTGTLLSYAAMYHPWIVTPDTLNTAGLSLRTVVPDGAVSGLIASKTLASGAWIAPANLAIANAVALEPSLAAGTAQAFFTNQINLIAQQPGAIFVTGQDTLVTDEPDLQPLNVRRLMILLRRLALREGVRYVFQNISAAFRRAVTRQFTQWMQQLLAMGAFAGNSASDSYRVVTDASVNTQAALDQGQFVVALQVAPSVPMRFLTVKLVQSGGLLSIEES